MSYKRKSPIPVIEGGTGAITMTTAYAPVISGTTATGALQVASTGLSTSGFVLTSTGAASLPTFQAVPSGGITTINGDSGSVTGATVTLTGSTSGAVFTGSGSTMTQSFNYISLPTTDGLGNGEININGSAVFHTAGTNSCFAGKFCGNVSGNLGSFNNGFGLGCLNSLDGGSRNNGFGSNALTNIIDPGHDNNGFGDQVLLSCTVDIGNSAFGSGTLNGLNGGNYNSGFGWNSLNQLATGSYNVGVGYLAGANYTGSESNNISINTSGTVSESNVLRIGAATGTGTRQLNKAFISGITGIVVTGAAAIISSGNQLGVLASSARYKENIKDIADFSSDILKLRPVTFNYNFNEDRSLQVGLIAEEVEKIMPSLVSYDQEGLAFTVKYQDLHGLMLNELQKALKRIEVLEEKLSSK